MPTQPNTAKKASQKTIVTPKFRVSFPALFHPQSAEEGKPLKYGVTMLFKKGSDLTGMKALVTAVLTEKFGPDKSKRPKLLRLPFRDGDEEKSHLEGYAGHIFVKATSKSKPQVVDRQVRLITDESIVYAGCYAVASVSAFYYDNTGNKGVSFALNNVQFIADGEPFSGRTRAEDDFTEVPDDDETPAGGTSQDDDI